MALTGGSTDSEVVVVPLELWVQDWDIVHSMGVVLVVGKYHWWSERASSPTQTPGEACCSGHSMTGIASAFVVSQHGDHRLCWPESRDGAGDAHSH